MTTAAYRSNDLQFDVSVAASAGLKNESAVARISVFMRGSFNF
jgi:hypothetical protein